MANAQSWTFHDLPCLCGNPACGAACDPGPQLPPNRNCSNQPNRPPSPPNPSPALRFHPDGGDDGTVWSVSSWTIWGGWAASVCGTKPKPKTGIGNKTRIRVENGRLVEWWTFFGYKWENHRNHYQKKWISLVGNGEEKSWRCKLVSFWFAKIEK